MNIWVTFNILQNDRQWIWKVTFAFNETYLFVPNFPLANNTTSIKKGKNKLNNDQIDAWI